MNSEKPYETMDEKEIQSLIQNTKVVVNDAILSINTVIDPDMIVSVLDD